MSFLHELFSRFDALAAQHGVLKIETVVSSRLRILFITALLCTTYNLKAYTQFFVHASSMYKRSPF